MTKRNKIFSILLCVLLGIMMLWTTYISYAFIYYVGDQKNSERYGLYVGGVDVTAANAHDILGDGTASYDAKTNKLTLNHANIEYNYAIIYSEIDLLIELIGENKLVYKNGESGSVVYASNDILRKDLSIYGDGTLEIAFENVSDSCTGIVADNLYIGSDVTVTTLDCADIANGIVCTSSFVLRNNATVTVNNGAARSSTAVSIRGNATIEKGSSLDITVKSGVDACNGLCVDGDLTVGRKVALHVAIDDENAENSDCINVSGRLSLGRDSTITASAKKANVIECYGTMILGEGAVISGGDTCVFCAGAVLNEGAVMNVEFEALGGIHTKAAN